MKSIFIKVLFFCVLLVSLQAKESVYILPKESDKVIEKLEKLIEQTQSQIDIAVYNFEYKKIAKFLKKASKKGIKINILFEKKKLKNKKAKYEYLCKNKNIECKTYKEAKQHMKLMIFDNTVAMLGSANLTKESFRENLELIYFSDNLKIIQKLKTNFKALFAQ